MRLIHRGLSLVEIVLVLILISVMMAVSLPMLSMANATARSQLCQQNLTEIAQVIVGYVQDESRLPVLDNGPSPREGQSLAEFIQPRLAIPQVTFCPSDETELSRRDGTSYQWGLAFNGQDRDAIPALLGQRMLADREAFHPSAAVASNELRIVEDDIGFRLSLTDETPANNMSHDGDALYLKVKKISSDE